MMHSNSSRGLQTNALGQAVGSALPDWAPPPPVKRESIEGRWCRLEPLEPDLHSAELYSALSEDTEGACWTYMGYGPFDSETAFRDWMIAACGGDDPLFFAVRSRDSGLTCGFASFLEIRPERGSIEVGHICFAPSLQRTRAGTEAIFQLVRHAFELGYRRCEWKCDSLNAKSERAALRYGFRREGIFRQAAVYKGRNRDTSWFSVIDRDWPSTREQLERWLDPENFDANGRQRSPLSSIPSESGSDGVAFRSASRDDLPGIVELLADDALGRQREQPGPPLPSEYWRAFEAISADPLHHLLVVARERRVLGVLQLTYLPSVTYRGRERALIEGVRISADLRGQGVGQRFVTWAIEQARFRKCHMVQLTTDRERPDALRFYESLGFVGSHVGMKLHLPD